MERVFVDTNLLCYIFDDSEPEKKEIAKNIVLNLQVDKKIQISTQVLQELSSVLSKKFGYAADKVYAYVAEMSKFPVHCNSAQTILLALRIKEQNQLSF